MIIRPATRQDLISFYGEAPKHTVRGLVGEKDGEIVGVGGYYLIDGGSAIVFTNYKETLGRKDRVRGGRAVMDFVKRLNLNIFAVRGENNDTLEHFGFTKQGSVWRLNDGN